MKKKKKRKPKEGDDDFASKLAALELEGKDGEEAPAEDSQEGDMAEGTGRKTATVLHLKYWPLTHIIGIWQHDNAAPITYNLLLSRFFTLLSEKNPDHATGGTKSYKIPPPQCLREGNKKTIFSNIAEICKRMKRSDEHVTAYLFAELGTSGSVDGSRRLVIKGNEDFEYMLLRSWH